MIAIILITLGILCLIEIGLVLVDREMIPFPPTTTVIFWATLVLWILLLLIFLWKRLFLLVGSIFVLMVLLIWQLRRVYPKSVFRQRLIIDLIVLQCAANITYLVAASTKRALWHLLVVLLLAGIIIIYSGMDATFRLESIVKETKKKSLLRKLYFQRGFYVSALIVYVVFNLALLFFHWSSPRSKQPLKGQGGSQIIDQATIRRRGPSLKEIKRLMVQKLPPDYKDAIQRATNRYELWKILRSSPVFRLSVRTLHHKAPEQYLWLKAILRQQGDATEAQGRKTITYAVEHAANLLDIMKVAAKKHLIQDIPEPVVWSIQYMYYFFGIDEHRHFSPRTIEELIDLTFGFFYEYCKAQTPESEVPYDLSVALDPSQFGEVDLLILVNHCIMDRLLYETDRTKKRFYSSLTTSLEDTEKDHPMKEYQTPDAYNFSEGIIRWFKNICHYYPLYSKNLDSGSEELKKYLLLVEMMLKMLFPDFKNAEAISKYLTEFSEQSQLIKEKIDKLPPEQKNDAKPFVLQDTIPLLRRVYARLSEDKMEESLRETCKSYSKRYDAYLRKDSVVFLQKILNGKKDWPKYAPNCALDDPLALVMKTLASQEFKPHVNLEYIIIDIQTQSFQPIQSPESVQEENQQFVVAIVDGHTAIFQGSRIPSKTTSDIFDELMEVVQFLARFPTLRDVIMLNPEVFTGSHASFTSWILHVQGHWTVLQIRNFRCSLTKQGKAVQSKEQVAAPARSLVRFVNSKGDEISALYKEKLEEKMNRDNIIITNNCCNYQNLFTFYNRVSCGWYAVGFVLILIQNPEIPKNVCNFGR